MKKVVAMVLSLVMAFGLMAGCGQKDSGSGSGAKTVESLKIAFSPYADADQITTATEPLEALLKAKLLEKGYDVQNIDMTVGTSYTAVGEALSAGSADIGFISGGNYVLFSDDCDVLLTALRYGINKDSENAADWNDGTLEENTQDMTTYYRSIILAGPSAKGQALLAKVNSGEELTWDDLNGATWSVLAPTSASGYIYPSLWLQEHYGKTIADLDHVVQSDSHSTSLARLATGQADVMVSFGHIRIKNAPNWQEKFGGTAPMVEQTGVIGVTEGFSKTLEINGVGYRAAKEGQNLVMHLGFSHTVTMSENADIQIDVPNPNQIIIKGIDKEKVGQFAAEVRAKRPPEPYKGKGIKYDYEHIRRKEGKTGAK